MKLNPPYPDATYGAVSGVGDGQQVGTVTISALNRASLWTGTAASWVDLNPFSNTQSEAYGVSGGQQVGMVKLLDGTQLASLWTGTKTSWVNLHPAGASGSTALAVGGGQQVGSALFGGVNHAGLWTGTSSSWVDLHPPGASISVATGVSGGQQVGYAGVAGLSGSRAIVWSGSAASWVDLNQFLSPDYSYALAHGIWTHEGIAYVVGLAKNSVLNREEAVMWIGPAIAPPPCFDVSGDGIVNFVDITSVLANWGTTSPFGDADHDGDVDFADITALLTNWGNECDG